MSAVLIGVQAAGLTGGRVGETLFEFEGLSIVSKRKLSDVNLRLDPFVLGNDQVRVSELILENLDLQLKAHDVFVEGALHSLFSGDIWAPGRAGVSKSSLFYPGQMCNSQSGQVPPASILC